MPRLPFLFCTFLTAFLLLAAPCRAGQEDTQAYQQAFAEIAKGRTQSAQALVARGPDATLNLVLKALLMAQPGNDYSFTELTSFVSEHPEWPGLNGIMMIAEQKIPDDATYAQIVNWFSAHPPLTPAGFYRYIDALDALGRAPMATTLVRDRWINRDFASEEMSAFHARFGNLLTASDHKARLDRLLWNNNITAARAMYPFVDQGMEALAEARIALANQLQKADGFVRQVPAHLQRDAGLLYERARAARKDNQDRAAIDLLLKAPSDMSRPDLWWDERNILIRRMMERQDFSLAYELASDHGLSENAGFDYLQAEFMAGWLALRFLNRPDVALRHFDKQYVAAATPISRSRGAYWLARTYEVLKDGVKAKQFYETAAALNMTYYGQLATARLYTNPTIETPPEPPLPENFRTQFFAKDSVRAVQKLYKIGETDRARLFVKGLQDDASQRIDFVLLIELTYKIGRPDWAINAAKAANQKNFIVSAGSYPVLTTSMPTEPDRAFTHALIRQESLFNADATSSAGAKGLMQLLPSTAKDVARKLGMTFRPAELADPSTNIRLGTKFVQDLIDSFDGSYILALSGYNAGPRRAREWVEMFGDPRNGRIDPIDWVEMIPIYETRNYVQRILENLQIYRARLNGGKAPLRIVEDLKR